MSKKAWLILVSAILLILVVGYFRYSDQVAPYVPAMILGETELISEQVIETKWISTAVPKVISEPRYDLNFDVLRPVDRIDIWWHHPAKEEVDEYTLQEFRSGDTEAGYRMWMEYENLLPGENTYEIVGYKKLEVEEDQYEELFRTLFVLDFDFEAVEEINPEMISWQQLEVETESVATTVRGELQEGVDEVLVYSWHPRSGKATVTRLNKYQGGALEFEYFTEERFDNLLPGGVNMYLAELFRGNDLVGRKSFEINSLQLTLEDEVQRMFGTFRREEGGWFVSSNLPWFSLRPVYEEVFFEKKETDVLLSRPTLTYTSDSNLRVGLCDYLRDIDYLGDEEVIYRGYSFETCQKYGFGVTVYDRFLSVLRHEPVKLVHRTAYQGLADSVSSAVVMIETGGMKEGLETITRDVLVGTGVNINFDDVRMGENDDEKNEERYYLYQMLITEEVPYVEKNIGDIAVEMKGERKEEILRVREFLGKHRGEELFTKQLGF